MLSNKTPLAHLKTEGACITPNAMFKNDSQGLPEMIESMYNGGVIYKKNVKAQNNNMKELKILN